MLGVLKALVYAAMGTVIFAFVVIFGFILVPLLIAGAVFALIFGLVRLDQAEQREAAQREKTP